MKVSTTQPFQIIYSLFQHEYLGFLFESFVVHLDDNGKLTFQHQNISIKNAKEFSSGLDDVDYELIKLMDSTQQESIYKKFNSKNIKIQDFFIRTYDPDKGNELLQNEIAAYLERKRAQILERLKGKMVFEMGNDGEPAWRQIEVMPEKATVLFHFRRNDDNTHYFPTIKYANHKLEFQYKGAILLCKQPAWLMLENKLYHFEKEVDGHKLKPFLNKKFIVIPRNMEATYYEKFVAPLIASFDVYAKGFEINTEHYKPVANIIFAELQRVGTYDLFEDKEEEPSGQIFFELKFKYGPFKYRADHQVPVSVSLEKIGDEYIFHRIRRRLPEEKELLDFLTELGLPLKGGKASLPKTAAMEWINRNLVTLQERGFVVNQKNISEKKYFLGKVSIDLKIDEGIDWFDIKAVIRFGDFEIPFADLRRYIAKNKSEFELPNGEIAVIPESWFSEYSELFAFIEEDDSGKAHILNKHHLALVNHLQDSELASVQMSRKLEKLRNLEEIDETEVPATFKGELRPYQKAGYDWLSFLNEYKFGGCLADDMGLGKTVQTLALLQKQKDNGAHCSLLIMPTSLIYNWQKEIKKFTSKLKVLIYTGPQRKKDPEQFKKYDVVLTSYGITRIDYEVLAQFHFNYIILDESQAIKNPSSNIAKAVNELQSCARLILTGTPIENSTLDLWSQMNFINPNLLGSKTFFKNEFLNPIEKHQDETKTKKLYALINPFILRRQKSQVAKELPEKVENLHFSKMSQSQEEMYEEVKSAYRNEILDKIETSGLKQSQFLLLQGLTKLRQIANHPKMIDDTYQESSGKLEDILPMLKNAIEEGHKTLVFSQFVKHLSIFRELLTEEEVPFTYLDGSTKDRQAQVEKFQNDPEIRVFLISLKAGGLGLNLTAADYVFILDPWWNPAIESQAVDRAHRIGQDKTVFTYKFVAQNTVEEKILALQQKKLKLAQDLITTEESFVKNLSKEDISLILE